MCLRTPHTRRATRARTQESQARPAHVRAYERVRACAVRHNQPDCISAKPRTRCHRERRKAEFTRQCDRSDERSIRCEDIEGAMAWFDPQLLRATNEHPLWRCRDALAGLCRPDPDTAIRAG